MGDSSVSSNSSSNSVNGVAREQDRQVEDLKSQHEKKLARLRADQEKEENEVRTSGDAAINHIRRSTEDRIEGARTEGDAKIHREDDSISKDYASLKRRSAQTLDSSEREITASKDRTDRNIDANRTREAKAIDQSQEKLKDFVAKQRELRTKTETSSGEQLRDVERRGNAALRKVSDENNRELRDIQGAHQIQVQEINERNKDTYTETKIQAEQRVSQLRRDEETKLKRERDEGNADFSKVHQKSHDEIIKAQKADQERLSSVLQEDQQKMELARAHALSFNEKTQAQYSGEAKRIEHDGALDINARTEKFNRLKVEEQRTEKDELNEIKAESFTDEQQARAEHEAHLQETISKLSETLAKQTEQFKKKFDVDAKTNRESLHNQKEIYLREQRKQKFAADKETDIEVSRQFDNFYKPNSFEATLRENPDHYVLTAKVPAYEKDNVEVRVKDDKIILSGARSFKDDFKDGGSRAETSSHQSYRQEFALARPADAKRVMTSIKDDGSITAIIPKKGFSQKV